MPVELVAPADKLACRIQSLFAALTLRADEMAVLVGAYDDCHVLALLALRLMLFSFDDCIIAYYRKYARFKNIQTFSSTFVYFTYLR